MNIAVINGSGRHGSTWHCMDLVRQEIAVCEETSVTEFFLPKAMPEFCSGCFSCFFNGEQTCPHADSIEPIVRALEKADVIILTSSVYAMDVTGPMKSLLDHHCFMWGSHRPNPALFDKIGLTVVTTAGAGLSHTTKTLKNSLRFWGVKRILSVKHPVGAFRWEDVSDKKLRKIKKTAQKTAKKIMKLNKKVTALPSPLFRKVFFTMMASMMKKNTWNPKDKEHWQSHDWLDGKRPF